MTSRHFFHKTGEHEKCFKQHIHQKIGQPNQQIGRSKQISKVQRQQKIAQTPSGWQTWTTFAGPRASPVMAFAWHRWSWQLRQLRQLRHCTGFANCLRPGSWKLLAPGITVGNCWPNWKFQNSNLLIPKNWTTCSLQLYRWRMNMSFGSWRTSGWPATSLATCDTTFADLTSILSLEVSVSPVYRDASSSKWCSSRWGTLSQSIPKRSLSLRLSGSSLHLDFSAGEALPVASSSWRPQCHLLVSRLPFFSKSIILWLKLEHHLTHKFGGFSS